MIFELSPVPELLARVRGELAASFKPGKAFRVSRAPGRLDVMGGIADYTGSGVCEATLDRAAAVALQGRDDRQVQVFSFNLLDDHRPFTFLMPLDRLASAGIDALRKDLAEPGRRWGGYLLGCLAVLHDEKLVDLADQTLRGINLALLSTVPLGAGVSSSAAIEVATMLNLIDHFGLRDRVDPMRVAAMCQRVENQVVGAPCGIMDQAASCAGQAHALMRMVCQPHELQPVLRLPAGVRAIGINSNVKHSVGDGAYGRTRCAAFMGHRIILDKMRQIGAAGGKQLVGDPMNGYLANLDPDDYKKLFRPYLPEQIKGGEFLMKYGNTIDRATAVEPDVRYAVRQATDHHVLEAMRVRNFVDFLTQVDELDTKIPEKTMDVGASERSRAPNSDAPAGEAATLHGSAASVVCASGDPSATRDDRRALLLNKAGHLMYASHQSYTFDAMLGADECDLLVKLVRDREPAGFYGAKITGGGSGGTVAILCDQGERVDAAVAEIMAEYQLQTGLVPDAFLASSPGAWEAGTGLVESWEQSRVGS